MLSTTIAWSNCSFDTNEGSSELRTGWPSAITVPNSSASTIVCGTRTTSVQTPMAASDSTAAPPSCVHSRIFLRS